MKVFEEKKIGDVTATIFERLDGTYILQLLFLDYRSGEYVYSEYFDEVFEACNRMDGINSFDAQRIARKGILYECYS